MDDLLSGEAPANVVVLILGNKIDIPYAASEEELRYHLGLTNFTSGMDRVNLKESNVRLLEVFMCSIVRKMVYGGGFKWLSHGKLFIVSKIHNNVHFKPIKIKINTTFFF